MTTRRVGVIGLGTMGGPMARRLLAHGYDVVGCDVVAERADELKRAGGAIASSPIEVASQVDRLLTSLPTLAAVEEVWLGPDGIIEAARPGFIGLDMSTSVSTLSQKIGAAIAERGAQFLDCPVSGSSPAAEDGSLVIMGGGDRAAFEAVQDILHVLGKLAVHCGDHGRGNVMKLVINTQVLLTQMATVETMALGIKAGLDPKLIYEVGIHGAADSYMFRYKAQKIIDRDFVAGGHINSSCKDLGLINALAQELRVPLALTPMALQMTLAAQAAGFGALDNTVVFRLYERLFERDGGTSP